MAFLRGWVVTSAQHRAALDNREEQIEQCRKREKQWRRLALQALQVGEQAADGP